jgi:hypothetical protein
MTTLSLFIYTGTKAVQAMAAPADVPCSLICAPPQMLFVCTASGLRGHSDICWSACLDLLRLGSNFSSWLALVRAALHCPYLFIILSPAQKEAALAGLFKSEYFLSNLTIVFSGVGCPRLVFPAPFSAAVPGTAFFLPPFLPPSSLVSPSCCAERICSGRRKISFR